MSAIQAEVFEAFRAIDVPEDKALRAAAALASAFAASELDAAQSLAKRDGAIDRLAAETTSLNAKLTAGMAALDGRITSESSVLNGRITTEASALNVRIVKLDGDVALLKWMVGFSLALLVTLLFRSFSH